MAEVKKPHAIARVRVRYAETDQMGVVYHANYLVWMEVGRVEILRTLGVSYKAFEAEGFMIAVVGVNVRYKQPARYDDEIAVEARVERMRGPLMQFAYRMVRVADGVVLAEGDTTHIVVDRQMQKAALPQKYAALFQELMA